MRGNGVDVITAEEVQEYLDTKALLGHLHDYLSLRLACGAVIAQDSPNALYLVPVETVRPDWKAVATRLAERYMGKRATAYLARVKVNCVASESVQLRTKPNQLHIADENRGAL